MPGYDEVTPVRHGTLQTYTPRESIGTQAKGLNKYTEQRSGHMKY
jgi:hypothetical protein